MSRSWSLLERTSNVGSDQADQAGQSIREGTAITINLDWSANDRIRNHCL